MSEDYRKNDLINAIRQLKEEISELEAEQLDINKRLELFRAGVLQMQEELRTLE